MCLSDGEVVVVSFHLENILEKSSGSRSMFIAGGVVVFPCVLFNPDLL